MGTLQVVTYILIGIGLSFDSFAVSVSCGVVKKKIRFFQACIVALSLAIFQALFPVIGWYVGVAIKNSLEEIDHWIAFFLLLAVGVKMIIEGIKPDGKLKSMNIFKPLVLITLSIATSIDALVVGLSLGFVDSPSFLPIFIIGMVTFIASMLGMLFGKSLSVKKSHQSLILGGAIIILIGVKILIEHLFFHSH